MTTNESHGMSNTPEYKCWVQLKSRCLNPNHIAFPDYGGRGLKVQEEFIHDFMAFYEHVGPRPGPEYSLDRKDNSLGYVYNNLHWVTVDAQIANRRPHRKHGVRVRRETADRVTCTTHGMTGTPEYLAWGSMKSRCYNPNVKHFRHYGGRGISVSPEWRDSFQTFYADMGPRLGSGYSLERRDNNGNYEKSNCSWATWGEQASNKRPPTWEGPHPNSTHYKTGSPEYRAWAQIKSRCTNPNFDRYEQYGAKGIQMCLWWFHDAEDFLREVEDRPTPDHVLMRIDSSGHFSCGHCLQCETNEWTMNVRWGTQSEANRNRQPSERSGKLNWDKVDQIRAAIAKGISLKALSIQYGVGYSLIRKIKSNLNWKLEEHP